MRKSPSHRRFWKGTTAVPAASASAASRRVRALVGVTGLSTTTGRPCDSTASATAAWEAFGVDTTTRSMSSRRARRSSTLASTRAPG